MHIYYKYTNHNIAQRKNEFIYSKRNIAQRKNE